MHAAVARTIERLNPEKLDERAALLAHHWESAGDTSQAARWHQRAAEWIGFNNLDEALRHWRKVQALTEAMPDSPGTLSQSAAACAQILWYGARQGVAEEEATALFTKGKALAERSGNPAAVGLILNAYGIHKLYSGSAADALASLSESATQADQTDDRGLRTVVRFSLAAATVFSGELSKALKHVDDGLALSDDSPTLGTELIGFSPHLLLRANKGYALIYAGRPHDGATCLEQTIDLAHQQNDLTPLLAAHFYIVTFGEVTGDTQTSLEHGRKSVDAAEKTGSTVARVCGYFALGHAHLLNGEWKEAVSALDHALTIGRDRNTALCWEAGILARLAGAYLGLGDYARSRQTAEEALTVARQRGTRLWEHHAQLILARVLMQTEGAAAAGVIEATLSAAQAAIEQTGAKSYAPFVHVERAELARLLGDVQKREHELRAAHGLFVEMGATGHAEGLAKELRL